MAINSAPDNNPSFDCVTGRHMWIEVSDKNDRHGTVVSSWCPWCGTGVFDSARVGPDGDAPDFVPAFNISIPDGFHRNPTTAR